MKKKTLLPQLAAPVIRVNTGSASKACYLWFDSTDFL